MRFVAVLVLWLAAAIIVGASGVLQQLRPPAPQLVLAALTIASLAAWRVSESVRQWLTALDLRTLIALHLTRFVGLYFIMLCGSGELPCSWAVPAGWGDVAVATLALALLVCWRRVGRRGTFVAVWNALGLFDILFVVASAARHGIADAASMGAMLRLPLSLLLTFLVPLIIASHVVVFSRLGAERRRPV